MDFYKILEEIMSEKDMSIPDVARACGLSDGTVRSIVARKSQTVSLEVAFKLSSGLNISLERLNGEGNRLIKNAPSDFSEEAKKIAKDYDKLDARGKGAVKAIMEYEGKAEAAATPKQAAGRPKVVPLPKVKRAHGFTEIEVFDQPAAAGLGNPPQPYRAVSLRLCAAQNKFRRTDLRDLHGAKDTGWLHRLCTGHPCAGQWGNRDFCPGRKVLL